MTRTPTWEVEDAGTSYHAAITISLFIQTELASTEETCGDCAPNQNSPELSGYHALLRDLLSPIFWQTQI